MPQMYHIMPKGLAYEISLNHSAFRIIEIISCWKIPVGWLRNRYLSPTVMLRLFSDA